ncbi:NUDIX domain-containing protein [Candidatus Shapirobacteria bacterium]|nr:NUDIX domain-containing protein [Candidatus Shapirobacteria bacterium]
MLITRTSEKDQWQIPGGRPEKGETREQTLERELLEEADAKVKNIKIIGAQKVEIINSPVKTHYRGRCACAIEKILPQTAGPAENRIWERRLVPARQVTRYVKWGVGKAIFNDAIKNYYFD